MADELTFAEKIKTLHFSSPSARNRPKVTVDDHETHRVKVTEHADGERQDVQVEIAKPLTTPHFTLPRKEPGRGPQ